MAKKSTRTPTPSPEFLAYWAGSASASLARSIVACPRCGKEHGVKCPDGVTRELTPGELAAPFEDKVLAEISEGAPLSDEDLFGEE